MLTPGSEKVADKLINKQFGAYTPKRDMDAVYHYIDKDDVQKAAEKLGIAGATPNGFVDYKKRPPEVYIDRNSKIEGTVEHETLHLYGLKLMGYYGMGADKASHVFEGLTEYFTRKIVDSPRTSYQAEYVAVQKLADVVGDPGLQTMFFQWKASPLIDCLGEKVANQWKDNINARKWDDAKKVLKGVKPCTSGTR